MSRRPEREAVRKDRPNRMSPLWVVLLLSLLVDASPRTASGASIDRRVASRVSQDRANRLVRRLARLGPRRGGTARGDRAAAVVAGRMRRAGLRVRVIEDPPHRVYESLRWEVLLDGESLESAWPFARSPAVTPVSGDLSLAERFGPRDREPAPGAGRTVSPKNRIVLTGLEVTAIPPAWIDAGVVAVLSDFPRDPDRYRDWTPIRTVGPTGDGPAVLPVFGVSYQDGRRLRRALSSEGPARVTLWLKARFVRGRPRTVSGTLPGEGPRSREVILVCAHGDADGGGPGADDNASGVAAVIEIAHALAWAAGEGILPDDRPSVRFVIWGAERYSSGAFVRSRPEQVQRIRAVFNLDEVGTGAERDALYYEGNDIPWNEELLRTVEAVAREFAGKEGFWTAYTSNPVLGDTDADSFLPPRYKGSGLTRREIPTTTIFTAAWDQPLRLRQTPGWRSPGWRESGDLFIDYSAYYHSSGDTPENTVEAEPFNLVHAARLVALSVLRLMQEGPVAGS